LKLKREDRKGIALYTHRQCLELHVTDHIFERFSHLGAYRSVGGATHGYQGAEALFARQAQDICQFFPAVQADDTGTKPKVGRFKTYVHHGAAYVALREELAVQHFAQSGHQFGVFLKHYDESSGFVSEGVVAENLPAFGDIGHLAGIVDHHETPRLSVATGRRETTRLDALGEFISLYPRARKTPATLTARRQFQKIAHLFNRLLFLLCIAKHLYYIPK
jgi:hypothetical protein